MSSMFSLPRLKPLTLLCAAVLCLSAGISVSSPQLSAEEQKNVLIVGDSVAAVLNWWKPAQKPFWNSQFNLILETHGCQALLGPGCKPESKVSALEHIIEHRKDNIDIVVVMTGYNDPSMDTFKEAIVRISREVKSMNASLVWGLYRESNPVKIRARKFNNYLRKHAESRNIALFDWNKISKDKDAWFRGENVHMNAVGGTHFARTLRNFLDHHVAKLAS